MKSAIYEGKVYHERLHPKKHAFTYNVFMIYFCLDEIDKVLSKSIFWGKSPWSLARLKREDFYGDPNNSIDAEIKNKVKTDLGIRPDGRICLLANLRYFGTAMNPLITYYCFDKTDELIAIVAQVNNTPWNETHSYVIPVKSKVIAHNYTFNKAFTVSPFNTLDMEYAWSSNKPDQHISININTRHTGKDILNATLNLQRKEITSTTLNTVIFKYPFHSAKVVLSIYWEALRIWLKGIPFKGKNKVENSFWEQQNENH